MHGALANCERTRFLRSLCRSFVLRQGSASVPRTSDFSATALSGCGLAALAGPERYDDYGFTQNAFEG